MNSAPDQIFDESAVYQLFKVRFTDAGGDPVTVAPVLVRPC
jgi:hypothetical protein